MLFLGIFVLVALFGLLAGFGVGVPELTLWIVMVVGWVCFWMFKRRR